MEEYARVSRRMGQLTLRQTEMVEWMIAGLLVKQIADVMGISERTVKAFRIQAIERMQAKTSCELVARYIYEKLGIEFKPIRTRSSKEREKIPAIGESRI
jgi:FixJ family two-component response regulator